ncbi:PREDICTED: prothoracicotropic hormone-like [Papilio xuthus]|uniref:Prothoracicotropic hormone-like n=1 Tax=Papilio xuthus TaxID=66420 RepID=A0AAJ6ZRQ1_PAPXU|nr:PREDICTED: prothoracicotropic hormone-like [Papilio xuthus]
MKIIYSSVIQICAFILITQLCIIISAVQKTSDITEFTVENQRTHRRPNFRKRVIEEGMPATVDESETYSADYIDTETNLEELPSLIVDYANMIRNDIILLDNSVETRSRKRGNLKFKRDDHVSCSCERKPNDNEKETTLIDLGVEYFPRYIEKKFCANLCPPLYRCQESVYNLTILKKKGSPDREDEVMMHLDMPRDLKNHYVAIRKPVTIGCICTRDFIEYH